WQATLHRPRIGCGDEEGPPPSERSVVLRRSADWEVCTEGKLLGSAVDLHRVVAEACSRADLCMLRILLDSHGRYADLHPLLVRVFGRASPRNLKLDVDATVLRTDEPDPCALAL